MINLNSLTLSGIGNFIETQTIPLNTKGITQLKGINGTGKSTILNTIFWVLYSQKLKKNSTINTWPHIQPKDYKGSMASLSVSKGKDTYIITRCQEYKGKVFNKPGKNKVFISLNGKELENLRDVGDINKFIIELIGYSPDLFKNTILFAQNLKRIIDEDGPTRKKILEETLDIMFVQKAKKAVEERICKLREDTTKLEHNRQLKDAAFKDAEQQIEQIKENEARFEETKEKRIKSLEKEISDLKALKHSTKNREDLKEQIKALEEKLSKNKVDTSGLINDEFAKSFKISGKEDKISEWQSKIRDLKIEFKNIPTKCPKCKEPIKKDKIKNYQSNITKKIEELEEKITETTKELKQDRISYKATVQDLETAKKRAAKNSDLLIKINKLNKELKIELDRLTQNKINQVLIEDKKKQIQSIQSEVFTYKTNLPELKKKVERLSKEYLAINFELEAELKKLRTHEWLLDSPLSNSGLKAFIMDSMFAKINKYLAYYTEFIGFQIRIEIDLASARKDMKVTIIRFGKEVPNEDLSGGQKQIVNFVLFMAISDSITETKPLSFLAFDEPFESLDADNVEIVSNIIQDKAKTRNIYLVTHQKLFLPICNKIIELKLDSNGHAKVQ